MKKHIKYNHFEIEKLFHLSKIITYLTKNFQKYNYYNSALYFLIRHAFDSCFYFLYFIRCLTNAI